MRLVEVFTIKWSEANPVVTKAKATTNDYVILEADGDAKVNVPLLPSTTSTATAIRHASGQKVGIDFDSWKWPGERRRRLWWNPVANVNSNGVARRGTTLTRLPVRWYAHYSWLHRRPDASWALMTTTSNDHQRRYDRRFHWRTNCSDDGSIQVVTEADQDDDVATRAFTRCSLTTTSSRPKRLMPQMRGVDARCGQVVQLRLGRHLHHGW